MHLVKMLFVLAGAKWRYGGYVVATNAREAVDKLEAPQAPNNTKLLDTLLELHPPSTACVRLSASAVRGADGVKPPRDVYSRRIYRAGTATAELPDITNTTVKLKLDTAASSVARNLDLSGLPDAWVKRLRTGPSDVDAAVLGKLRNIVNACAAYGLLIQETRPAEGDYAWKDVASLAEEAGSNGANTTVTMRAAHGWVAGDRIQFTNRTEPELAGLSGIHSIVAVPAATTLVVATRYRSQDASISPQRLRAKKVGYEFRQVRTLGANEVVSYVLGTRQRQDVWTNARGRRRAVSRRR